MDVRDEMGRDDVDRLMKVVEALEEAQLVQTLVPYGEIEEGDEAIEAEIVEE